MPNELQAIINLSTRANDMQKELRELERLKLTELAMADLVNNRQNRTLMTSTILGEFDEATRNVPEFNPNFEVTKILREEIAQASRLEDFYIIQGDYVKINAKAVLGDWTDFRDGINKARQELNVSGSRTKIQKARYWRENIYIPAKGAFGTPRKPDTGKRRAPSKIQSGSKNEYKEMAAEMYDRTMELRADAWGGFSPLWIVLEQGNTGSRYAYPRHAETNFMAKAERYINNFLKHQLEQLNAKIESEIYTTIDKWIDIIMTSNTPIAKGTILESFQGADKTKDYVLHITPDKGWLGVRGK